VIIILATESWASWSALLALFVLKGHRRITLLFWAHYSLWQVAFSTSIIPSSKFRLGRSSWIISPWFRLTTDNLTWWSDACEVACHWIVYDQLLHLKWSNAYTNLIVFRNNPTAMVRCLLRYLVLSHVWPTSVLETVRLNGFFRWQVYILNNFFVCQWCID
jgi:hypothetical protein